MDERRKDSRIPYLALRDELRQVEIILHSVSIDAEVEDISLVGIGLIVRKINFLHKGDIFIVSFPKIDRQMKSVCVYCEDEDDDETVVIGAYFLNPFDEENIHSLIRDN